MLRRPEQQGIAVLQTHRFNIHPDADSLEPHLNTTYDSVPQHPGPVHVVLSLHTWSWMRTRLHAQAP
jgi:hypothetical protein